MSGADADRWVRRRVRRGVIFERRGSVDYGRRYDAMRDARRRREADGLPEGGGGGTPFCAGSEPNTPVSLPVQGWGLCVAWCPEQVLVPDAESYPLVAHPSAASDCKACERYCPDFASKSSLPIRRARLPMSRMSFMHGNEAVAEGVIAAGCRFDAGYLIMPSIETAEICRGRLPEVGGVSTQMEDEIASIRGGPRRVARGMKSADRDERSRFLADAGEPGPRGGERDPVRIINVQRGGPEHRSFLIKAAAGRRDAGALGHARR